MTKLLTSNMNVTNAKKFVDSLSTDYYYSFVSNHLPYPGGDSLVTTPTNDDYTKTTKTFDNMLFAEKIKSSDLSYMIVNHPWVSNTVYTQYDQSVDLSSENFYAVVYDITEYNVYKCLNNNLGAPSTVSPFRVGNALDLEPIITSDGYIWKYMSTIPLATYEKFATSSHVPLVVNTSVVEAAIPGTVNRIDVVSGGKGYDNYITTATFSASDIEVGGVVEIYGASASAVPIDDYYTGCVLRITSGLAAGDYRRIVDYIGQGGSKKFILESGFTTTTPSVNDTYEVYPYVYVWGDGAEDLKAEGICNISNTANSIASVEVINFGSGYRKGSVTVGSSPSQIPATISSTLISLPVSITNSANFEAANLIPIISPACGHGGDPYNELFANKVCVYSKYQNTLYTPANNDFRQVGIIKNPKFNLVDILHSSSDNFIPSEEVKQFKELKLYGTLTSTSGNTLVTKTDLGKISTSVSILNGGWGYNSTVNNYITFNNTGTGGLNAAGTFSNNANGTITTVTITNQGQDYASAPTGVPAAAAGGANAQFQFSLANLEDTTFEQVLSQGDEVLLRSGTNKTYSTVAAVNSTVITLSTNSTITATNTSISLLETTASGIVTSASFNQISISNATNGFIEGGNLLGTTSLVIGTIKTSNSSVNAIEISDKASNTFNQSTQLMRLVGDFSVGSNPFIADEKIRQASLVSYAEPSGYLHHAEINAGTNDDILYVSNTSGIFNSDPAGLRTISGDTSSATLTNLSNKYTGDFVVDSGEILYLENLTPISRGNNKAEVLKIILEF